MIDTADALRAVTSRDTSALRGLWLTILTADVVEAVLTEDIRWVGVARSPQRRRSRHRVGHQAGRRDGT